MAQKIPVEIDKFYGVNKDIDGETQLRKGESSDMENFRITENYKLKKLEGYKQLFDAIGHKIKGMWYGKLKGIYHFLFACNGNIYSHDVNTGINTSIGTLTNDKTYFFGFNDKVYMLNGHEYKYFNGTNFGDVEGYIPIVYTATSSDGKGTPYESINLLTGKKGQQFMGNGTDKTFHLAETNITSVDKVYVNGVLKIVTTDYTVDKAKGSVTFKTVPPTGSNNIEIYWNKNNDLRDKIISNYYAMFYGGKNDTRIFVYGNGTNEYYFSGLANGVPTAEYFPECNTNRVSTDEFQVTDIVRQYDRQIIFTNGGETWYSHYETIPDTEGNTLITFPVYPLNQTIGNVAPGQVRVLNNNPFSIQNGVYEWIATNVRDERNAEYISKRVQTDLDSIDLTTAITCDWEEKGEYWLCVCNKVWVYNYRNDTWYIFNLVDTPTCFLVIDGKMYFGTSNGQIMKFDDNLRSFNGLDINAYWQMGFYDAGAEWLRKYLNYTWIALKRENRSKVDVYWETNKDNTRETAVEINYNNLLFYDIDFNDFSFEGNYNPQPFRVKTKAKKWIYFRLILKNCSSSYTATILSVNMLIRVGGQSK